MSNKTIFLMNDQNAIFKLEETLLKTHFKLQELIDRDCFVFEEFSSLREELKMSHGYIDFEIDCMPIFNLSLSPHGNIILPLNGKLIDFGNLDPHVLISHFEGRGSIFRDDEGLILDLNY